MPRVAPRPSSDSLTEMTELVLPQHANVLGTAFGGAVLSWVDVCGAIAAARHAGRVAVTAAIDEVQFRAPIRVGDVVVLAARVNAAFGTSVEVEVRVDREAKATRERTRCLDALMTFVAVDEHGTPAPVPPLACATDDERARAAQAAERRANRLARKRSP